MKQVDLEALVKKGYNNLSNQEFYNAYMYMNQTDKVAVGCTECFKRGTWTRMVNIVKKNQLNKLL